MGGFKLTGLGAGTSATDAAQFGQLQNAPVATLITVAGADTITGTLVQTLTAYATGQQFSFVAAGTNTTAVTLNIDGLGAKAVTRTGAVALAAGALVTGQMAIVEYDGTRFQLINANAFTNLTLSGALTYGGVTLASSVTGTSSMVLSASPTLSGTVGGVLTWSGAQTYSAAMTYGGVTLANSVTGTGSMMLSASPTTTGTLTAAAINASGLVAMAGAATVGTTLAVTGASTMAAINASGLVAMAGAATVGTTLAVTGTSTMAAINASGDITLGGSGNSFYTGVAGTLGVRSATSPNAGVVLTATADGVAKFTDWDATGPMRIGIGGISASFPALKRSGTTLAIRLADDSADAPITASNGTFSGTLAVTGASTLTGNVGVGTSPSYRFHVVGATAGDVVARISNSSATGYGLRIVNGLNSNYALAIGNAADTATAVELRGSGAAVWTDSANTSAFKFHSFVSNSVEAGSITRVGTTAVVTYNTTSDYRAKDVFGEFKDPVALLSAFTIHEGQFKGDVHRKPMVIAHEVQAVTPWAVVGEKDAVDEDGKEVWQQVATGAQEALLISGWQNHEARLAALQADFEAYKAAHP